VLAPAAPKGRADYDGKGARMKISFRGEGPLVVKLAGIAGGTGLYEEEMDAAARAGFRVAALDTSGDRADDSAREQLTWDFYSRQVEAGIDRGGGEKAILWGTSFGCLVALAAAARRPSRVTGLLLAHPPDPRRRPRSYAHLRRFAEHRPDPTAATRALFSVWFLGSTAWEAVFPPLWIRLPSLWRAAREAATPAATVRTKLDLLVAGEPGLPPAGMPVEMIAGAWDWVAPRSGATRLSARIAGSRLHVMGLSGHAGAYTRPATYRRLVVEALRRIIDAA
jgi:pimeloyl-ACP methyl ester carboxylesterase